MKRITGLVMLFGFGYLAGYRSHSVRVSRKARGDRRKERKRLLARRRFVQENAFADPEKKVDTFNTCLADIWIG